MTDRTLGASGLWLGTRTGAGGTTTLTERFFGRSPFLHGQIAKFPGLWIPCPSNPARILSDLLTTHRSTKVLVYYLN